MGGMGEGASRLSEEQSKDKDIRILMHHFLKAQNPGERENMPGNSLSATQTPPHNIQAAQALLLHQRDFPVGHSPTSPYPVLTVRKPWIYVSM